MIVYMSRDILDVMANHLPVTTCPTTKMSVPKNGPNHGFRNEEYTIIDVLVPYLGCVCVCVFVVK